MRLLALVVLSTVLSAAPPVLRELSPRGAQRGKTVTLRLRGDSLTLDAKLQTTLPAGISRMTPSADVERMNSELPFLVTVKADAAPGLYPVRLLSSDGLSNVLLFAVGDLPEFEENESKNPKDANDAADKAEAISIPAVMNGTLPPADQDFYSFNAKAGQKLVFEVEARRAGSAVDPAMEVLDAAGRLIGKNDDEAGVDSRMQLTFAKAGQYFVRVHDSRFSDQTVNFYRLKVGSYSYADGLFPLGWNRREPVEVELNGGNLGQPVKVKAQAGSQVINLPGSDATPLPFVWSDKLELLEPAGLTEGAILNGRISKPGEIDKYKLAVKAGEQWFFELNASSLGTSQLDALVTVYDEKGKKLVSRDDTVGADSAFPLKIPKDVREITVAVEDLLGRGGPNYAYRLEARRESPDFVVALATPFVNVPAGGTSQVVVTVLRRGYDGPLELRIPNLPQGFTVAGGHVPSEAAQQLFNDNNAGFRAARSVLTITADPEASTRTAELTVVGIAQTPTGVIRRTAVGPGMITGVKGKGQKEFTAAWLGMSLPMAVSKPLPVSLEPTIPLARFAQGFEFTLGWRLQKRTGAGAVGKVNSTTAGAVGNLRVLRGEGKGESLRVSTNFATPATTFDVILETTAEIDGRQVAITAPAVTIQVVPGYQLHMAGTSLKLTPGGTAELRGTVYREPTFQGSLVKVQAADLPDHVTCAGAEVPETAREFTIACKAGSEVSAGDYEIRITSVAPETGRKTKEEYKIADIDAKLSVAGQTSRAAAAPPAGGQQKD